MINQNRLQRLAIKVLKISCLMVIAVSYVGLAQASAQELTNTLHKSWPWSRTASDSASEDSDLERPTSRRGGQSRNPSACLVYPVALIPGNGVVDIQSNNCNEQSSDSDYSAIPAYTETSQSTIWVYIPEYNIPGLKAKITLEDNRRDKGDWEILLPSAAGVVCFAIPYTLDAENTYAWEFEVLLTPNESPTNPKVSGFVEYAQQANEYWYDELQAAIQQRVQSPSDTTLVNMLESQGLSSLATASFPENCQ